MLVILRWDLGLTLFHSEGPKLYGVLAVLSANGLKSQSLKDQRRGEICNKPSDITVVILINVPAL